MREFDRFPSFIVNIHQNIAFFVKGHVWNPWYWNADNFKTSVAKNKLEAYSKSSLHKLYLCCSQETLNFYFFMSKTALKNIDSFPITVFIIKYTVVVYCRWQGGGVGQTRPATPYTVGKCLADFPEQNNIKYNTMKLYVIKMWQNNLKLSKQNISLV